MIWLSRCRRRRGRRRRARGWRGRPTWTGRGGRRPSARLPRAAGEADAVGADLGMAQVEADAAGEAAPLRPRVGDVAAAGRARHRRDDPPVHAEARVELADVVQQRGRDPARVVGVRRVRRAGPARRGRPGSRGGDRGRAGAATARTPSGVSTDSTHATSSGARRPGRQRADEAPREVEQLHRPEARTRVTRWSSKGARNSRSKPVENTRRNSTRKP